MAIILRGSARNVGHVERKVGECFCSWYIVDRVLYSYMVETKGDGYSHPPTIDLIIFSHPYLSKYDDE